MVIRACPWVTLSPAPTCMASTVPLLLALTRWPAVHLLDAAWFYRMLTFHGINMLIFWILFFEVAILYFAVARVETSLERIARRVRQGGHDVAEAEVRRRWTRSLSLFPAYAARAVMTFWREMSSGRTMPATCRSRSSKFTRTSCLPSMTRLPLV